MTCDQDEDTAADTPVHELVTARAAAHPERTALDGPGGQVSYGELDARAGRLARRLIGLGARPGEPVGLFLERSADFVVAALAVLKAGGAYVPLDPDYPAARLELMLAAAPAPLIVTTDALAGRLPAGDAELVPVADEEAPPVEAVAPGPAVRPEDLAYVMFTSGSTGTPKAVAVPHAGITRLVHRPGYVRLDDGEVLLHASSPSFDAATFEIWGALANGARLVVAPPGRLSAAEFAALLRSYRITTAFFTTGLFHVLVDEARPALAGLRQVLAGGDAMSGAHARALLAAAPGLLLVNGYGPTEVTTFTTCHRMTSPADVPEGTGVPIGVPIRRTVVRLLDDAGVPVPDGTPGRLFAGGDGVARGYLNDPELTARRFVPDPWSPGGRLYDTGDLVRRRHDGVLEFIGRADRQVKRRGFRVEPAEIEAVLRRDPAVRDAAVVAEGESAEDRRLVAHLVPDDLDGLEGGGTSGADLVAAVRERARLLLPEYLIPDRWAVRADFPLDVNGKVDRRALSEQGAAPGAGSAPDGPAPRGELERQLARIWCDVLDLDRVSRDDDFFDLGGQSLQMTRMVARVRGTLGVELPLTAVFDAPTLARLAEAVAEG